MSIYFPIHDVELFQWSQLPCLSLGHFQKSSRFQGLVFHWVFIWFPLQCELYRLLHIGYKFIFNQHFDYVAKHCYCIIADSGISINSPRYNPQVYIILLLWSLLLLEIIIIWIPFCVYSHLVVSSLSKFLNGRVAVR